MGILQDIKRLGLQLEQDQLDHIKMIEGDITNKIEDGIVRETLIEMHVSQFIEWTRPDIMTALLEEKNREVEEWQQKARRKFDEQGNRVCEEELCDLVTDVAPCRYCGKYICRDHNFADNGRCCYDCSLKHQDGN